MWLYGGEPNCLAVLGICLAPMPKRRKLKSRSIAARARPGSSICRDICEIEKVDENAQICWIFKKSKLRSGACKSMARGYFPPPSSPNSNAFFLGISPPPSYFLVP